jgi:hypothetical protein
MGEDVEVACVLIDDGTDASVEIVEVVVGRVAQDYVLVVRREEGNDVRADKLKELSTPRDRGYDTVD